MPVARKGHRIRTAQPIQKPHHRTDEYKLNHGNIMPGYKFQNRFHQGFKRRSLPGQYAVEPPPENATSTISKKITLTIRNMALLYVQ